MNQTENDSIIHTHLLAFGEEEGNEIAKLAEDFLALAETISISVKRDGRIVGNVLYSPFVFHDHPDAKCYLLAPNGVTPEYQGHGIGKELMETGIEHLKSIGVDAIFVLGVRPSIQFMDLLRQTSKPRTRAY